MELAEKLKSMRKKAGLTQKEVADKLGITYQSYGQYERGLRKPKYETVEKFAKALNFDIYLDNSATTNSNDKNESN